MNALIRGIVNRDVVNLPFGEIEVGAVRNSLSTCPTATGAGVCRPAKVTADGGVQHQRMFREMRCNVAVPGRERCRGRSPSGRVGVLDCDISGDGSPGKAPDVDAGAIPEMREHAAGQDVEAMAITFRRGIGEGTTAVIRSTSRTVVTDDSRECALRVEVISKLTPLRRMKRVLIRLLLVDAFQHINFTLRWPIRSH